MLVKTLFKKDKTLYICEYCNVAYVNKKWADKCETWDKQHPGSCNLEIVQHSVSDSDQL